MWEEKIREFVNRNEWRWAKTMPALPHEYIKRGSCRLTDSEFLEFVNVQREFGVLEWFNRVQRPYLYLDGYKYWTMGCSLDITKIMNRQKIFSEFDGVEVKPYYSDVELSQICAAVSKLGSKFFEIGCGDGSFIRETNIEPKNYKACEPCRFSNETLKKLNPNHKSCVIKSPFETKIASFSDTSFVIIGLFGSPSYIMRPYLKMIAEKGFKYFLMFYKYGWKPEYAKSTHEFKYSKQDLKNLFPCSFIRDWDNYIIVASQEIEIPDTSTITVQTKLF